MADMDESGSHSVIIVSREELNRGRWVIAVMLTSARFRLRSALPNCVPFHAGQFGLTKDCVAQAETISAIPVDQIDTPRGLIGVLDDEAMRSLIHAMGHVLASECEPE